MTSPYDIIRVVRVLEYVGERRWMEATLSNNAVKGTMAFGQQSKITELAITMPTMVVRIKERENFKIEEV